MTIEAPRSARSCARQTRHWRHLVAGSEPDEPLRVFAGRKGFLRQAYGPGWALVGDAGYFKDPLTAHGITDALRDAELLANAAAAGTEADFADYAATRDDLSMPLFEVSDAIAALDWDLDQIRALHQTLNHAMKREVEHLLTLGDAARPLHPANPSHDRGGSAMNHADTEAQDIWHATIGGKPKVGAIAERARQTSMRDVEMFSEMTGDRNPLHYDAALAAESPFGGLIVQGGVTSGLLNAIVAEDLPGPGSVFLGVEWRFVKAVGIGEQITGRVEVTGVRDDKPICTLATSVRNAQGETCLVGSAVTYTVPLRRPS